jgi:hypothetical protein
MLFEIQNLYFYFSSILLIIISILGIYIAFKNKESNAFLSIPFILIGIGKLTELFFPFLRITIDESGNTIQKESIVWYYSDAAYKIGLFMIVIIMIKRIISLHGNK